MSELDLLTGMSQQPVVAVAIQDVSNEVLAEIARTESERDANRVWVVAGVIGCVAAIMMGFWGFHAWMSLDNPLAGLADVRVRVP